MKVKHCLAVLGITVTVGLAIHAYRRHQHKAQWQDLDEQVAQWEADRVIGLTSAERASRERRIWEAIHRREDRS